MDVIGLDKFGLTAAGLKALGNRQVRLSVYQQGLALKRLQPLRPAERLAQLGRHLRKGLLDLRVRWPAAKIDARGDGKRPWTFDAVIPAKDVLRFARTRGIARVSISRIQGLHETSLPSRSKWFCLWGRVAIQIEGMNRGGIDVEDRLMLVRAKNEKDARAKIFRKCKGDAEPYLNSSGIFVRWMLTDIEDVYMLFEEKIDPNGTEVYSRIRQRKMKASDRWLLRGALRKGAKRVRL